MLSVVKFCVCVLFLATLCGCQSYTVKPKVPIAVEYPARTTLAFTGRGAAAGMMMSGSMGAMGIAIGVAIDEGIAKDLHAAATQGGFVLKDEVDSALAVQGYKPAELSDKTLVIRHMGFRASGDLIVPWVELDVVAGGEVQSFTYAAVMGDNKVAAELAKLKGDATLAAQVLRDALVLVLAKIE